MGRIFKFFRGLVPALPALDIGLNRVRQCAPRPLPPAEAVTHAIISPFGSRPRRIAGVFGPEAVSAWTAAGCALQTIRHMDVTELRHRVPEGAAVIDVRSRTEWETGHMAGVKNFPLGGLEEQLDELPRGRPLVCQGGSRPAIATSLLQSRGVGEVVNLAGGFAEWQRAGLPVERD